MKFKIPDQDTVCKAVSRVMLRNQRIESQRELSDLVQKELSSEDPEYRISGERIRKVAVSSGAAKVEIEYREAVKKKLPDICPVCGNAMSPIMNMTLEGDVTEVKRNCTVCPFTAGQKACSPGRYIFVRTPPHSSGGGDPYKEAEEGRIAPQGRREADLRGLGRDELPRQGRHSH